MKTYVYKLYKSKKNKHLNDALFVSAEIWNHCIALHKKYYKVTGKHISAYKMKKHLTKLKRLKKHEHWNNLGSQAVQDIAERIDRSYTSFFRWIKTRKGARKSPPKFRKRRNYSSFTLKQAGYSFDGNNSVTIMKRRYKYHVNREIEGTIKTVTIKRDAIGDYYLYVVTNVKTNEVYSRAGNAVGLDFGLKTFLTASDSSEVQSPLFFAHDAKLIAKLNRNLSKKKKGSRNRKRAKLDLARQHKRIENRRTDFHRKLAQGLASNYATICIENLNLSGMQRLWGKKISDLAFSNFVLILEQECIKTGSILVKVNRFFPSSQLCSGCGVQNKETKDLKIRKWTCPHCGKIHDRDVNAAINILNEGLSSFKKAT